MRRRLAIHAAGLAAVLLLGLLVVGTDGMISADEGAMLAQLDLVDRTGGWTLPNPDPAVDPAMAHLPMELSERTDEGRWAPFAKHPAHIALLLPAWRFGGEAGVLLVSLLAVVAAGVCAWLIAERLRPGLGPRALWLTGVGSPLLFDGYQVVGHALGAALFGAAAVAALRTASRRHAVEVLVGAAAVFGFVAGASLVRTEAVLAGGALGAVLVGVGVARRDLAAAVTGAAAAVGAALVRLLEPRMVEAVLGGRSIGAVATGGGFDTSGLGGKIDVARLTVLEPGYGVDAGEQLLSVTLLLLTVAAIFVRLGRDPRVVRLLAVVAVAAAVGRMLTADFLVPGLLPAFPIVAVAAAVLRRDDLEGDRLVLWGTAAVFAAAVLVTQYESGGEWGGRYFAIVLPLLGAVALATAWRALDGLDLHGRRVVGRCFVAITVTIALGALGIADRSRRNAERIGHGAPAALAARGIDVAVSTDGALSRFAWEDAARGPRRWLTSRPDQVGELLDALAGTGEARVGLFVDEADALDERFPGWTVTEVADVPGAVLGVLERDRAT